MTGLIDGGSHFRMRIILETILNWLLVFHVCVPECSRNGLGECSYLWVQKNFVYIRQSVQNARLFPAEILGQFFKDSAFNLFRNFCDISLVNSRNGRVSWLAVPGLFLLCFSCNSCQLLYVSQCRNLFQGKMLRSFEGWISFCLLINLRLWRKGDSSEELICRNQYSQLNMKLMLKILINSTSVSLISTFSLAGNLIVYTPSEGTKQEKVL